MTVGVVFALGAFALYSAHDVVIKLLGAIYSPVQIVFFAVLLSFPLVMLFMLRNPKTGSLWPHHPAKMAIRVVSTTISAFGFIHSIFSSSSAGETKGVSVLVPIVSSPEEGHFFSLNSLAKPTSIGGSVCNLNK